MGDATGVMLGGINLPDFLHPKAVFLRLATLCQIVFGDDLLGQGPAHPFGQEHVFAMKLETGFIGRTGGAVGIAAKFARDDALDLPLVAINQFGTGKAGENLDPQRLGLLGHPAADIAHRHDVIAVIGHQRRHQHVGNADLARLAQHEKVILGHRHGDRRLAGFPIGDQPVKTGRIEHCARQDMRPNLGPFFQHDDRQVGIQLFQPDRR